MDFAYPLQKVQDWFTQQWIILTGRKIDPLAAQWLLGPFGNVEHIEANFIDELVRNEKLIVDTHSYPQGLLPGFKSLDLSETAYSQLPKNVVEFYEQTSNFDLTFQINWNRFFTVGGILLNVLFSNRLQQLQIPVRSAKEVSDIDSQIVSLIDPSTQLLKYTYWLRSIKSTGQIVYSGIYGLCTLPDGRKCVKAVFPLPNGNATVILHPSVGNNGEFILDASGERFGDAGFYFLLRDSKGKYWSKHIRSFRDRLLIKENGESLIADQKLTLWHLPVLRFTYQISKKKE